MEIRDPVHGSIKILNEEIPIIESAFFQRLRSIKQLGFSEYVFPGATHTRYLHSIGVMDIATKVFDQVFKQEKYCSELRKLKESVRLACLLHDIGHAPLSHTTEVVMPNLSELKLPKPFFSNEESSDRQATHEDYTIKSIVDSSFTPSFEKVIERFGVNPIQIAELIIGETSSDAYFTVNGINYFPLLHQLVSSEMDCDRMDYLLRDSYFCGVSYGKFDLDWIIDNLNICIIDNKGFLGITQRAVSTFDDFLLSRFHMFLMVYFHYKSVCLEKMLHRYFKSSPEEYKIPSDIEKYLEHDDHKLMKVLRSSNNEWAKKIVMNQVPRKILETYGPAQKIQLKNLEKYLVSEKIDYIKCSSSGRLSKYYSDSKDNTNKFPLKVMQISSIDSLMIHSENINEATDLFEKFSHSHTVNRIHCEYDQLTTLQQKEMLRVIKQ